MELSKHSLGRTFGRLALAALIGAAFTFAQVNVLTANYDNKRTNANLQETILSPSNLNTASFGKVGSFPVDGLIYAQPLYVTGVQIAGKGAPNVVYVVTMHNSVYAINADAPQSTVPLWQVNLGASVPSSVLSCIDVLPEVGIMSTPVIDLSRQAIYVVADTLENGIPVFRIHALSLSDGHEMLNGPAVISATVTGSGAGSSDGSLPFDASMEIQRPGIALANGNVYVGFGSHCDAGNWHGWLMAYDASNLKHQAAVRNFSPNGIGASIWQSGRAPAIDDTGNIFVVTSNGDFDGASNFSESVLKLAGADLSLNNLYTPDNWSTLNDNDWDLGSTGAILLPNSNLAVAGDKSGALHFIDRGTMGHDPGTNTTVQTVQINGGPLFEMALWNSPNGPILYVQEFLESLQAFQIAGGTTNGSVLSQTGPGPLSRFAGIAVSANGAADGTAIVWQTTGNVSTPHVPGTLHALDATNLANEFWNSDMVPGDALGRFAKFVAPTVANGRVYVPTFSYQLVIYGLQPSGNPQSGPAQITGIVNGASFLDGPVSPGELLAIFGSNLGPTQLSNPVVDESGHVTTTLSDTQVLFDGVVAPVLYTSSNQTGAIVPFGVAGPTTQVQVQYQGQLSLPVTVSVVPAAPALFALDGTGGGPGAILNQDGSTNSSDAPASRGSIVVLYATGLGQTSPPGDDGTIAAGLPLPAPILSVSVFVDDQSADVLYAGAATGLVQGVMQINVRVPAAVSQGEVHVMIQAGNYSSPTTVTLVVQ